MRVPRIHVDAALAADATVELPSEQSHYLSRVLRLGPDSPVVLFNGDGHDYAGVVQSADRRTATVLVEARVPATPPSRLSLTLVQSLSRGERMDYTLQKATELGVRAIQPVVTGRCEVRLKGDREERRLAHWRKVVVSACEQCGRADVPAVLPVLDLETWRAAPAGGVRLVLDPTAERSLAGLDTIDSAELLVGPEGGLDDDEYAGLRASGVLPVRLGPRVLRTETAGPAAIAVLQALSGDLG